MKKHIVCLGGGTGTSVVLSGLKKYPVELTAVVSMADSGGANRIIRDEFGLLPTSDIRQCFVALAENRNDLEHSLRELFVYRFPEGKGLKGMTFGNLFMAALTNIFGSQIQAIKKTGQILRIKGKVLPATLTDSNLAAVYENGKKVIGENLIDEPRHNGKLKIKNIYLQPKARAYPEAVKAILKADLIVIGPGDLYTSLMVNLTIPGIARALRKTKAKIVYILNLMTKFGQTYGFSAQDHIRVLEKYLGKGGSRSSASSPKANNFGRSPAELSLPPKGYLDFVLVNSKSLPEKALKKYKKAKEFPVADNLENSYFKVVRGDFLSRKETKKVPGDVLKRTLIRHDSEKLAKALIKLCQVVKIRPLPEAVK